MVIVDFVVSRGTRDFRHLVPEHLVSQGILGTAVFLGILDIAVQPLLR